MTDKQVLKDAHASVSVIVVDVHPEIWQLRADYGEDSHARFEDMLSSLIVFCNAYLLLHRDNKLCIIANHPAGAEVVYPRVRDAGNMSPPAHLLGPLLAERLLELHKMPSTEGAFVPSFPQALSTALCIFSSQLRESPQLQPRLVLLQLSKDHAYTYNAVMNCIFSAQKLGVQVDAVVFGRQDSSFLQQACFITGGVYLRPEDQRAHLQLMMTHILPSNFLRTILRARPQASIDNQASCFCHSKPKEFVYMCSVCLGLACEHTAQQGSGRCGTCGTRSKAALV